MTWGMTTLEEIRSLAAKGESENVEFKATTAELDRAARTIAGMANQAGGSMFVGVKADGTLVGQEVTERTLEKVAGQINRVAPSPICSVTTVPVDERFSVIVIRVEAGPLRPYRWNNKEYLRTGAATLELSEEQARQILLDSEHQGQRWEDLPSDLSIDDLDAGEIRTTVETAIRLGRVKDPGAAEVLPLLRGLGLLDSKDGLTNAATVLFATEEALLRHHIAQCQLKVARFLGTQNIAPMGDEHQWTGNLFALYRRADRFLLDHLRISAVVPKDSWIRVDTPEIPPTAMREAVLNALAHRDYSMWSGSTSVGFFDDRVEIASPGLLHFGLTPNLLYAAHQSMPWNPRIARVLHQRGMIETWGMGFNKMVDEVREAGLVVPLVSEVPNHLVVTFTRPGWAPIAYKRGMSKEQGELLDALFAHNGLSIADAERMSGRPRRSVQRDLRELADRGLVELVGKTRSARWVPVRDLLGAKATGPHAT